MHITLSKYNAKDYKQIQVDSMADIAQIATKKPEQNWSCGIFKDDYRNLENFHRAYFIGLDIDGGMTLKEAKKQFNEYKHCIVTSRSHQKEKHGVTADRFRVVLQLKEPIKDVDHFYATWFKLEEQFPAIDPACKDASRMWYTGNEIIAVKESGILVDVCKDKIEKPQEEVPEFNPADYGKLSKLTNNFLEYGAGDGLWNRRLFKAAKDMQEQGYALQDAVQKLKRATLNFQGDLDSTDLQSIQSAYSKTPKHGRRAGHFKIESLEEMGESEDVRWTIDGLLAYGGMGVFAGKAGLGKSTITRQLARCICEGKPFLGRPVSQGNVFHIMLEENRELLRQEGNAQGLNGLQDKYFIHAAPANIASHIGELEQIIVEKNIRLVIIDPLLKAANNIDINSDTSVNQFLVPLQALAQRADTAILFIHHQNKNERGGQDSVAGSYAIAAAGDLVMTFEGHGRSRFINTTKVRGGKRWDNLRIEYDEKRRWYEPAGASKIPNSKRDEGF